MSEQPKVGTEARLEQRIEKLLAEQGIKADSNKVLNLVKKAIVEEVADTGIVKICKLGRFETKARKARKGYNPATEESIIIPATQAITFKPFKKLKVAAKNGQLPTK